MCMKRLLIILVVTLWIQSCKEVGPNVDIDGTSSLSGDTTYLESNIAASQDRVVLLEEFTGVRCVNCPRAHATIKQIQTAHPGRVLAVGIHTGIFAQPYTGRPDFKIPEGNAIEQALNGAQGYPSGAVDRTLFAGESRIIIGDNKWSNYVNDHLAVATPVNINLAKAYNAASRQLDFTATIRLTAAYAENLYFSAYLIEDDIIDYQLTPTGIDSSYSHTHVLRKLLTPLSGQQLNAPSFTAGRVVVQRYSLTIGSAFNVANLKIIAFVHNNGTNKSVLHAAYSLVE